MMRMRKLLGLGCAVGATLWSLPLWAEEAGESQGLPQFDVTQFPAQLFWLALAFGLLYVMMTFVALPRVRTTQDKRQGTIASELEAATAANESAKSMIAQYEKALLDARTKAQATVDGIVTQAGRESAEKQAVQQKELAKRMQDAEAKITAARDAALKEVKGAAADLASSVIEKIAGLKVKA